MKTAAILNANLLDIIFENRNKDYGAYTLRKFYNNRLYKAMGITFSLVVALLVFSVMQNKKVQSPPYKTDVFVMSLPSASVAPLPEKPKKKIAQNETRSIMIKPATQIFTTNIKITKENTISKIQDLKDNTQIGTENIKGDPSATFIKPKKIPEGSGINGLPEMLNSSIDRSTPTAYAEIMPQYPGGLQALRKFLEKNLRNPQNLEEAQEVVVKIRFIVGYDGTLKGFETIQDGGAVFNNEVMRVLKKMPQWIPGKTKGENVSVYYMIPVNFKAIE